jgi:hypothetical protein
VILAGRRHARQHELDKVLFAVFSVPELIKHATPPLYPVSADLSPADRSDPHNGTVETPDFFQLEAPAPGAPDYARPVPAGGLWAAGERVTWIAGLVLALSSFMGWYAGSGVGVKLAVIGWHSGVLGKLVFFVGLAVLAVVALHELGFELPPAIPESLLVLSLGALAAIFVLIRIISIPDSVLPADGRGIGIWIALIASLGVIAGGLLRAAEEL